MSGCLPYFSAISLRGGHCWIRDTMGGLQMAILSISIR